MIGYPINRSSHDRLKPFENCFFLVAGHRNQSEDEASPIFDIDTILAATNSFSIENKIGEGGFGPVYKVILLILFPLRSEHLFLFPLSI